MRKKWWILGAVGAVALPCVVILACVVVVFRPSPWQTMPSLTVPRQYDMAAVGPDGAIYAIGGAQYPARGVRVDDTMEELSPGAAQWHIVGALPAGMGGGAAATGPDGRLYVAGSSGSPPLAVAYAFTPGTGVWTTLPPMPETKGQLGLAFGPGGLLYAIGGTGGPNGNLAQATTAVFVYHPASDTWSVGPPLPTRNESTWAVSLWGVVYASGSGSGTPPTTTPIYALSTVAGPWKPVASMPATNYNTAATAGPDGRIYVLGGTGNCDPCSDVYIYDPRTNTWSTGPSMSTAREYFAAVTARGRIWAIGGVGQCSLFINGCPVLNSVEAYTPGQSYWQTLQQWRPFGLISPMGGWWAGPPLANRRSLA